jgi:hypothetical protein
MSTAPLLPDCRTKVQKTVVRLGELNWVPIYCANCGCDGGLVPAEQCDFAFYLCIPCSETIGPIVGTYMEPDAVFWEKVAQEQIAKYGRMLRHDELVEACKDENSTLAKLGRDRPHFDKIKMT